MSAGPYCDVCGWSLHVGHKPDCEKSSSFNTTDPRRHVMKLNLTFKTPDVIHYATQNFSPEKREEAEDQLRKWIRFGESITVEFDLEAGTATVQEMS